MRQAKFECEECGEIIRADIVDVFEDGTLKPEGKYVMRGDHWYDSAGNRVPPTTEMYRIDERITPEPFCPACTAQMIREMAAPIFKTDKTKVADAASGALMASYGMTDMRDNQRAGDVSMPKLPPAMQQAADNMFQRGNTQARAGVAGMPYEVSGKRGMAMLQQGIKEGKL